ncbi:hypothetical protein HDU93_005304 [Gonapodya sp. JEL0774]|nr:hypothetical protein HDU93_005304 [Gonapodya sp. JEL0774]
MATVKIGFLAIRTIAKPVTAAIKSGAKNHPAFKSFCVNVAQAYHAVDIRLNASLAGGPAPDKVRPLSEAKAVELGADFLGEFLMFAIAAGIIFVAPRNLVPLHGKSVATSLTSLSASAAESSEILRSLASDLQQLSRRVEHLEIRVNGLAGLGKVLEEDPEQVRRGEVAAYHGPKEGRDAFERGKVSGNTGESRTKEIIIVLDPGNPEEAPHKSTASGLGGWWPWMFGGMGHAAGSSDRKLVGVPASNVSPERKLEGNLPPGSTKGG